MKKKKCPQCKNLILISAPTCLYCGRPNKFITKEYINNKWYSKKDTNRSHIYNFINTKYLFIIIIFLIIILVILFI